MSDSDRGSVSNVQRFAALFQGNERSYGVFFPANQRVKTNQGTATLSNYEDHLSGKLGLGLVPIMDDNKCWFAAIDIDSHKGKESITIDLFDLEKKIRDMGFPLTICRSKSGGAHLYLFGMEPLDTQLVRDLLAGWSKELGYAGSEIFPKQTTLVAENGNKLLGNWINLPWFDCYNPNGLRYAIDGGERISFEYFLELAELRRVSQKQLLGNGDQSHSEAPPCVQRLLANGAVHGYRNESLYNITVYLKKAFPGDYKARALMAAGTMSPPLDPQEAQRTIQSASRRDYRYKCNQEPCKSLCNSSVCVTRKFGITPSDLQEQNLHMAFGPLERILTDPPRWRLFINQVPVTLSASMLINYYQVQIAALDKRQVLSNMKNDQWQDILTRLMEEAIDVEAPDSASNRGYIKTKLTEFLRQIDSNSFQDRTALLRHVPVVLVKNNQQRIYWRGEDFVDFLKKSGAEVAKGPDLWIMLRELGVAHDKITVTDSDRDVLMVPSARLSVWYLPLDAIDLSFELTPPDIKSEI